MSQLQPINQEQAKQLLMRYLEKVNFENKKKKLPKFQTFDELAELLLWFFGKKMFAKIMLNRLLIYHRIIPRIYIYFLTVIQGCGDNKEWLANSLEFQDQPRVLDKENLKAMIGERLIDHIESLPDIDEKPPEVEKEKEEATDETRTEV